MKRQLRIKNEKLEYVFKKNRYSKNLRLIIHQDGRLVVTAPARLCLREIEKFLSKKAEWIWRHLNLIKKREGRIFSSEKNRADYLAQKDLARRKIVFLTERLAKQHGFSLKRISIRNQSSRWGSCSGKGNLNFHYKVAFLPDKLAEYVIIHELCHLKELNHSPLFWRLVEQILPDYRSCRRALKSVQFNQKEIA